MILIPVLYWAILLSAVQRSAGGRLRGRKAEAVDESKGNGSLAPRTAPPSNATMQPREPNRVLSKGACGVARLIENWSLHHTIIIFGCSNWKPCMRSFGMGGERGGRGLTLGPCICVLCSRLLSLHASSRAIYFQNVKGSLSTALVLARFACWECLVRTSRRPRATPYELRACGLCVCRILPSFVCVPCLLACWCVSVPSWGECLWQTDIGSYLPSQLTLVSPRAIRADACGACWDVGR